MIKHFKVDWENFKLNHQPLLVAVSTGVDSMVLLDLLLALPDNIRPQIAVAYVNHCLRNQSKQETLFIRKYCRQRRLPLHIATWAPSLHPPFGIEEAARKFRYSFFASVMDKYQIKFLATAHHADDLAETILMKAIRGGEVSQLVGIPVQRPFDQDKYIIRPLLPYSKQEIRNYATQHQLTFFEDETNKNDDVLRNRLRHHVIPKLKQENPAFLRHIRDYANQLHNLLKINQYFVQKQLGQIMSNNKVDFRAWQALVPELREAVLKEYLIQNGLIIHQRQLREILNFLANGHKPQGSLQLSHQQQFIKEYHKFYIGHLNLSTQPFLRKIQHFGSMLIQSSDGNFQLVVTTDRKNLDADFCLEFEKFPAGLVLRHREPGDWLRIKYGVKKLRRFFIDCKISQLERQRLWVIADQDQEVYAVFGGHLGSPIYLSRPKENATIRYIIAIKYRKR